jgi:hypothetical protein
MRFTLHPHPGSRHAPPVGIEVEIARPAANGLKLRYVLRGGDTLALPAEAHATRADELWRHTCFEAFLATREGDGYLEFNFSPSRAWAAYAFDRYRAGMRNAELEAPVIEVARKAEAVIVDVTLSLPANAGERLALTAVIEHADGTLAYWALAHAPGKPDFHHPDGFVATLPPPERP